MKQRSALLIALITLGALTRLVPHEANFTSLGAVALFAAFTLRRTWLAYLAPTAALLLSDVGLSLTDGHYSFGWINLFVLGAFCLTVFGGRCLGNATLAKIAGGALASSVVFFIVTNFGAWVTGLSSHPMTFTGLTGAYVAGIPFFWKTLAGTALYSVTLFGALKLAESAIPGVRTETATA
tara:strand:- start:763 stop:1305 length:543 start_codon:yes stop_codon:yes gene_type:complete